MIKTSAFISPLAMVLALALGALMPGLNQAQFLMPYLVIAVLFLSFLPISFFELKIQRQHCKLLAANLALGVMPWLGLKVGGADFWAAAAFFCGIMPTASAAPAMIGFLRGNVPFVLTVFVLDNFCIGALLLGLLPLVCGVFSGEFIAKVGVEMAWLLLAPWLASRLLRRLAPRLISLNWRRVSFILWMLNLLLIAGLASHSIHIAALSWFRLAELAALSLIFCALHFTLGFYLGGKTWRRECSQALGQKNTVFGLYLALTFGSPLLALAPAFYTFWHNLWNAFQLWRVNRHRDELAANAGT